METWIRTSIILCVFGFLKEFRPSEPFAIPYLVNYKNFTEEQVNQEIYPVAIYSWLALLVVVFLVTDILRYKPVIIVMGISAVIAFSMFCWARDVTEMQIMEIFYGLVMATEVAYSTYIYAQVNKSHYQKVTSHTRCAFLVGRLSSGAIGQALISTKVANYRHLYYITIASEAIATLWAVFLLPPVKHSMYFHRQNNSHRAVTNKRDEYMNTNNSTDLCAEDQMKSATLQLEEGSDADYNIHEHKDSALSKIIIAYKYLLHDLIQAYTNPYVLKWSIFWAFATCGFLQGITYVQMLWKTIEMDAYGENSDHPLNGAVETTYTSIGAIVAFACGWLTLDWQLWGELVLAICSALQGACLLTGAFASSLWLAYLTFILFGALYHPMITIANSEVAKNIREDSYALIFGINTLLTLLLQTVLTVIVVSDSGFALNTRDQFKVYGSCYLVMAVFFMVVALYFLIKCLRKSSSDKPAQE